MTPLDVGVGPVTHDSNCDSGWYRKESWPDAEHVHNVKYGWSSVNLKDLH